jgi:SAM-dependent methyltransferase
VNDSVANVHGWSRTFDVVVCADVLEHLEDPAAVLARVRKWLSPGGLLLVSLPNVANVAVRLSLLAGRFEYAEAGILDRTHLRFFTRRSARRLVEAAGFRIRRLRPTPIPAELAIPLLRRPPLRGPARAFFAGTAALWPTLFGYQFVIEAEPSG